MKRGRKLGGKNRNLVMEAQHEYQDMMRAEIKAYFQNKNLTVTLDTAVLIQDAYMAGFDAGWRSRTTAVKQ